jgi:putative phage-type endonuclease
MTAQLILHQNQVAADREAWLTERRKWRAGGPGITASEIATVLGISPSAHRSPFSLYHDKLMGEVDVDNDAMMRGRYLEPYVVERVEAEHRELDVLPGGLYASADRPWQLATFDRLVFDNAKAMAMWPGWDGGPVPGDYDVPGLVSPMQIKTSMTNGPWGEEWSDDMPGHIRAQVLQEMDVADADHALVPVLVIPTWKVRMFVVERDATAERDIEYMREQAEAFRARFAADDPPPIDWSPATTSTLKRLHPGPLEDRSVRIPVRLARQYRRARLAAAAADKRLAQAVNEIRNRLGNAREAVVVDGEETHRVLTRSIYPVAERTQTVDGYEVDKFNPCRWSK